METMDFGFSDQTLSVRNKILLSDKNQEWTGRTWFHHLLICTGVSRQLLTF